MLESDPSKSPSIEASIFDCISFIDKFPFQNFGSRFDSFSQLMGDISENPLMFQSCWTSPHPSLASILTNGMDMSLAASNKLLNQIVNEYFQPKASWTNLTDFVADHRFVLSESISFILYCQFGQMLDTLIRDLADYQTAFFVDTVSAYVAFVALGLLLMVFIVVRKSKHLFGVSNSLSHFIQMTYD
jgi:hypothetical protein